jgi:AhpD family alkylhydroperoxidase
MFVTFAFNAFLGQMFGKGQAFSAGRNAGAAGQGDALLAVSTTNGCEYCIRSHTAAARKAGMSEAMLGELMAVVGMANETNRLANGYQVEVDAQFMTR